MIIKLLRKLKRIFKILIGKITPIKHEININSKWYGNQYGGFFVHPDILNDNSIIYSFGIGEDISFDLEIIQRYGCKVFAFDPTPKSIEWIENQTLPNGLIFHKFGIDKQSGKVNFNLPKNKSYVSGSVVKHDDLDLSNFISVPMLSFFDILNLLGHGRIDVLKMDIEGAEFEIIESVLASNIEIKQILIELHERFFKDGKSKIKKLLSVMKKHGYVVFAVSESYEEVSFIQTDTYSHS